MVWAYMSRLQTARYTHQERRNSKICLEALPDLCDKENVRGRQQSFVLMHHPINNQDAGQ